MSIEVKNLIESLPIFVVPIDIRAIVACDDADYAERRQSFVNRTYALQAEINAEVETITANNISTLNLKHDELVIRCKEAKRKFDEVNLQAAYFQSSERNLSKEANMASFNVRLKKDSPLQPAYATKQDYAQWQSELDELLAIEADAIKKYYSHQSLMAMWQADRDRLANVHNELIREEAQIRHRLQRLTGEVTGPQTTSIGLSA